MSIAEPTPGFNLAAIPLKCPSCENDDKARMAVCSRVWLRASDRSPFAAILLEGRPPQAVDPIIPADGADTIECQAEVADDVSPVCRHRGSVNDFALYAAGTDVSPAPDPAVHGEPTPQPAAAPTVAEEA